LLYFPAVLSSLCQPRGPAEAWLVRASKTIPRHLLCKRGRREHQTTTIPAAVAVYGTGTPVRHASRLRSQTGHPGEATDPTPHPAAESAGKTFTDLLRFPGRQPNGSRPQG
jgi:hypothetical protein